ncbi:auxilin-like protein 1 isoform X2 [Phoenix dactylifera]|uniref:Auxilin-like protein 1 isoform X2 n=1 Tax=Phoenix dactylifera TaxID=42345 RepID=A0A8B7BTA7_PHODC|nr:auxilin-like protein 1 isoform X2 [Phoenix dactylifera]
MEDPPSYLLESHRGTAVSKKTPNGAARSAYANVFPPAFPAGPEDYAEIFGGLATSCSIPVLDLPPASDGDDDALSGPRSSGFDYADIFGGFDVGGFAVSYEELVAESKRPEKKTLSSNERIPKETGFHQQTTEISDLPSEGPNGSNVACLERDQILSDSYSSNDGSIQYDMPHHKTSRVSKEDSVNGKAHVTQSHAFPGSIFVADACPPSQNIESDDHANMVNNDLRFSRDFDGGKTKGKQEKIFSHVSSSGGAKCFERDMLEDQKHFTDRPLASEDRPTNARNHSRSSSYQSTSSGEISQPNYTFLTVSDISLQTQPLKVPPPSRPPPKADSKQGPLKTKMPANPKADLDQGNVYHKMLNHQTRHGGDSYKNHVLQEAAKENSSYCFDVEVDASSAAAASAAAMKEAMEQAQARLKSAKELMERKRDNFQSRKKLGRYDVNCKERKEYIAAEEVRSFTEGMTQETILKEDREVNYVTVKEKQEAIKAPMVTPDHEDKETNTASTEKARQTTAQRETRSSQPLNKLEERNGKWKVDKQFYELINNAEEFKIVDDVSQQEGFEKKSITAVKANEDKVNETEAPHDFRTVQEISEHKCFSNKLEILNKANCDREYEGEVAKLVHEHKRNEKLHAVESCEWGESTNKHGARVMAASEEVVKEILNAIPDASVQEQNNNELEVPSEVCVPQENESSLKDVLHFGQQGESEKKLKEEEELHCCAENKSNDAEEAFPCEDEDGESKAFQEACRTDGVYQCEGEYKKQVADKCIDCGREVNAKFVTSEPDDYDWKKLGDRSGRQDENNGEVGVPHGSCFYKVEEKMDVPSEARQCEENEKSSIPANALRYHEVNEYKSESTSVTLQQKETKKSNGIRESYESVSNENITEVTLEDLDMEKNEKKPEVALDSTVGDAENEKELEAAKEVCQQHNIVNKTREAQMEHQRNGKKQRVVQVTDEEEKFGSRLTTNKEEQAPRDIDHIIEVKVASHMVNCNMGSNVGREVCQGVENQNLEAAQQATLLEEKRNITNRALDVTESGIKTENTTADMQKEDRTEIEGKIDRKTEQKKELAKKLEEEKEREREREKDRIAVQRATHEAHERALAETRERAERIAVERVTAEARQRAFAEAREKAERASSESSEKSLASREAKMRAERAAVERATAEARERAAEKAAAGARERAERSRQKPTDMQDASNGTRRQSGFLNQGTETESALRCKARLERHRRTVERAAKALAEKNMRDMLAQREQAERNRLAESLDAEVRRWSNGKEGNLRALLSTLQYILGPDSGWQPVPLTEVITAGAVKKAYRKATLYVHPDKLQQRGASIHQKYICEKVFDLLKDAWNRFNSEER